MYVMFNPKHFKDGGSTVAAFSGDSKLNLKILLFQIWHHSDAISGIAMDWRDGWA